MAYNEQEREVLRFAKTMQSLAEYKEWKDLCDYIDKAIAARDKIVYTPLSQLPADYDKLDFIGRATALELIKGAVIGLRLIRSLPESTSQLAQDIVHDHEQDEELDA